MSAYADVEDPNASLQPLPPPSGESTKKLIEEAGWKIQTVNWVYEKVTGENLVESLIKPLLGDFEKIEQNAKAWDNVAKALDAVRHNLNQGLKELDPHWEGESAQKFEQHISVLWTVAIEADSQLAKLIGQQFESVAGGCKTAVTVALSLLDILISLLMEAAIKALVPGPGWASAVLLVKDAIDIVDSIRRIIIAIQKVIEGVQQMIEGVKAMGTALMKIKDVRSVNDAADVLDDFQEGKETYDEGRSQAKAGAMGAVAAGAGGAWGGFNVWRHSKPFRTSSGSPSGGGGGSSSGGGGGTGGGSTGSASGE